MIICGLDPSLTATGVALLQDGSLTESYVVRCGKTAEPDIQRFHDAALAIQSLCLDGGLVGFGTPRVDLVAIEDVYADRNLITFKRLAQLSAVIQYVLWRTGIPVVIYSPNEWRKACFDRNIQKEQVRLLLERRYRERLGGLDLETADLNALEATCIALAAHRIAVEGYELKAPARKRTPKAAKEAVTA